MNHRPHPYQGCALTSWAILRKTILIIKYYLLKFNKKAFLIKNISLKKRHLMTSIIHLMVVLDGIEPPTHWASINCSTNWATKPIMATPTGLEPVISSVTGRRDNQLRYGAKNGCGGRTWTYDLRVMSPTSYQLLHPAIKMAEDEGFEPPLGFPRLSVFKTDPFSQAWVIFRILFCPILIIIESSWMVDLIGLEPMTIRLWAGCSNQLS